MALELKAQEGLLGVFHAGVTWRAFQLLVSPNTAVVVEQEKALMLASKRFIPDLTVRCQKSGKVLLVVEVWHTHVLAPAEI